MGSTWKCARLFISVVMATDMEFNKTIHQTMGAMCMLNSSRKCSLACPSGFYKLPSKCVFFFFFFFISYIQRIFLKNMPVQHHPLSALLNYRKNQLQHPQFGVFGGSPCNLGAVKGADPSGGRLKKVKYVMKKWWQWILICYIKYYLKNTHVNSK